MAITIRLPKQKEDTIVPKELKPDEKLKSGKAPLALSEKDIKPEDLTKESN